ncbi:MAG TPA: glycosyltransferase family 4 protein, partial [Phycisphaerales bacterium]|nr:glycosyltransferase family 4 protein [Phycisphaerales bacterium]
RQSHVTMLAPNTPPASAAANVNAQASPPGAANGHAPSPHLPQNTMVTGVEAGLGPTVVDATVASPFSHTRLVGVPAHFASPYGGSVVGHGSRGRFLKMPDGSPIPSGMSAEDVEALWMAGGADESGSGGPQTDGVGKTGAGAMYRGDLIAEAERYARLVVALTRGEQGGFDVVHAHDWLTYPAGIALARASGKPLVVHVHSTEFDRTGGGVNQRVYDIERRGMMAAIRVIAVSELTRNICTRRYGVPAEKVDVVYNGISDARLQPGPADSIRSKDKIVLFLGRITLQKGPEYFIAAARRVLEKVPDAKFIMAGAGDMEVRMIELAAELGIGHRVLFTGFLRGNDVDRIYRMADCYVMPSVSEPFGLAPLEAMRADVPVIISKQSGVSEVLTHALKVDFWDTDEIANKIVAVLKYPPLGQTLREHGSFELRKLTWEGAAEACVKSYVRAQQDLGALVG